MEHRTLTLTEYKTAKEVSLSEAEAGWLQECFPILDVRPTWQRPGRYDLTPGSHVGTVALPGLTVLIRPKISAERVLFLISYVLDPVKWQHAMSSLSVQNDLVEGMAALFGVALRRALAQGVQQGYRTKEEALSSVRGRIRFDDQLRRRFLAPIPLEVTYDDFTLDTDLNRLLFAALRRLRRLPMRSSAVRAELGACHATFVDGVSAVEYGHHQLPELSWNRLNQHFRPAAALARAILASTSLELEHGGVRGTAFTIDMNVVFEEFVRAALRNALGLPNSAWPERPPRGLTLDLGERITLLPDLTWRKGGRVVFVGDAKYKRVARGGASNADLYQLHAYATALSLPAGLLVYAEGDEHEAVHTVRQTGTRLIVRTLKVDGQPAEVLEAVGNLALRVASLRKESSHGLVA